MTSGTTSRYGRTGYGGVVVVVRGGGAVGEEEVGDGDGEGNERAGTEQPYWTDLTSTSSSYFEIEEEEDAQTKTPRDNQIKVARTSVQA